MTPVGVSQVTEINVNLFVKQEFHFMLTSKLLRQNDSLTVLI